MFSKQRGQQATREVVDLRLGSIQYLNDLEQDEKYQKWSQNLQDYLRPGFPGQPRYIGKNAVTVVLFIDPSDLTDANIFLRVQALIDRNTPIRFGVLFVSSALLQNPSVYEFTKGFPSRFNVSSSFAQASPSIMMIRAYSFIKKQEDSAEAFRWLSKYFSGRQGQAADVTSLHDSFVEAFGAESWV